MRTSSSILCATDLSVAALNAANVAAALSRRLQKPLTLLSVAEPSVGGGTAERLRDQAAALDRDALKREADRLRSLGATVEEEFCAGFPDQEIVRRAARPGTGLVVVASHGHRALARWWLGSIAERTAEAAPIPTLVVRDAGPLQAWLLDDRPLRVFVGSDFTAQSDAALAWVGSLRSVAPCEITAAYIAWNPANQQPFGASEFPELAVDFNTSEGDALAALRAKADEVLGSPAASLKVGSGSGRIDSRLVEIAQESKSDLIVVGSHQWHGLDRLWHHSVSRGILHHAPLNVACVPMPAAS